MPIILVALPVMFGLQAPADARQPLAWPAFRSGASQAPKPWDVLDDKREFVSPLTVAIAGHLKACKGTMRPRWLPSSKSRQIASVEAHTKP